MKLALACLTLGALSFFVSRPEPATPAAPSRAADTAVEGLAKVYGSLADSILANKRSEKAVIMAILTAERDLVIDALGKARTGDADGRTDELQRAARHIGEFATEGGSIIEPIRNRLLQGGHHHHHHAQDTGTEEAYDNGYVVVSKVHKRSALDLAKRCAQLAAGNGDAAQITAIQVEFMALAKGLIDE
ncbi:MAG: hypothetical protein H6807_15510 [Planctomycetes bacterium]|nr:hypothetical protein [Planctomycetota bacterium]